MKGRLTKLVVFFMIFLLCFNIYNVVSMRLNAEKATGITDQTVSFLTTSNGADPLTLRVATSWGPDTLELVEAWDSASNDVLEQVVETLFFYDLTDLDLPRINLLAQSYHWVDTTHLLINLREGILFHDGTPFNASAAKWNLDRLLYLTNCSGTNTGTVAQTQSLWMFPDGVTPIINNVATVGEYNITITLNGAYAPLLSTLSYINAGMISPTTHAAEATSFIDLTTGILIGTGPFKYDSYVPGVEVKFTRWDDYWKGPAYFEEMLFVIFSDVTTAHNAFLDHTIDWNRMFADQNLALYDADPDIMVKRFTDDTGKPSLVYQYMGFNNEKYNLTWRLAMAHAIDYSYVIDVLRLGNAFRAVSAISPGFGGTYNASVVGPDFDIAEARTLMQSMGFGVGFTTDAQWIAVAEGTTPFLSVPHTYNIGNQFREDFQVAVTEWFKLIGINVIDDGVIWDQFLYYLYVDYDHLGVYAIGWAPDYLDPYNMLDPLFNPASASNSAQVNDGHLNAMMASALAETDGDARNIIYKNIQSYLARMQFHAPLYHNKVTYVHLKEIKGVPYNALNKFYAYPIYRATPSPFTLSSDAGSPDDDGTFALNWTAASYANNYSVYRYSHYITEINGSVTLLADEITDLTWALSGYNDGTYYFIVVAHNDYGDTLSNCIQVNVERPPPGDFTLSTNAGNPDINGIFDLTWTAASGANNYSIYRSSSFITVIDGSTTLLASEITDLTWALSGYEDGTYYYIVVAHNDHGDTLSNCIQVNVELALPSGDFTLSSNAGEPDTNGIFDLTWTVASEANNYSVYRSSSYITVIDGSTTPLASEITDLTWALSGYEDGAYYFIVVAHNNFGDTLSNCIEITVEKTIIPGYDSALILLTMLGISFLLIKSKLKRNIKLTS